MKTKRMRRPSRVYIALEELTDDRSGIPRINSDGTGYDTFRDLIEPDADSDLDGDPSGWVRLGQILHRVGYTP